jgi:hypothetical protein
MMRWGRDDLPPIVRQRVDRALLADPDNIDALIVSAAMNLAEGAALYSPDPIAAFEGLRKAGLPE